MAAETDAGRAWLRAWDPDGDGDDDSTAEGDTDHSHWTADGKQKKSVPGKPMPGQPPAPRRRAGDMLVGRCRLRSHRPRGADG
jgi:hypothetical protein